MITNLIDAKAFLRVDFDTDDALIERTIAAAEAHIETMLGYRLDDGSSPLYVEPPLRQAVLQLVAHWYDARQPATDTSLAEVPFTVADIIREFRTWSF
ncbi:MAG TPA: head-tail connector protein [Kaistia sp.]|nr:head-tail connector protein [Kaistia sp.]